MFLVQESDTCLYMAWLWAVAASAQCTTVYEYDYYVQYKKVEIKRCHFV
jgi:hypothetical protein